MNNIDIEHVIQGLYKQLFLARGNKNPIQVHYPDGTDTMVPLAQSGAYIGDGKYSTYGQYFCICLDVENFGYEKDGNTYHPEWKARFVKWVHVILTTGHRVFVAVTDKRRLEEVELSEFVNTNNHDSCWPDGLSPIRDTYYEGYAHCYPDTIPDEHRPAPIEMSLFTSLGPGFGNDSVLNFVRVEFEDLAPSDSYRKRLTKIVPLKFEITLTEE